MVSVDACGQPHHRIALCRLSTILPLGTAEACEGDVQLDNNPQRRARVSASLIASCTSAGVRPMARIVPAYGRVDVAVGIDDLVRQCDEVTGSCTGLAGDEKSTPLGLKDRDAHHVPNPERDPWGRSEKHVARGGLALGSLSGIRRWRPRIAALRMCGYRWREKKDGKGTHAAP
jgi:hypothetical protein